MVWRRRAGGLEGGSVVKQAGARHLHRRAHAHPKAGLPRAFGILWEDGDEFEAARLRLKQIRQALKEVELDNGIHLELDEALIDVSS